MGRLAKHRRTGPKTRVRSDAEVFGVGLATGARHRRGGYDESDSEGELPRHPKRRKAALTSQAKAQRARARELVQGDGAESKLGKKNRRRKGGDEALAGLTGATRRMISAQRFAEKRAEQRADQQGRGKSRKTQKKQHEERQDERSRADRAKVEVAGRGAQNSDGIVGDGGTVIQDETDNSSGAAQASEESARKKKRSSRKGPEAADTVEFGEGTRHLANTGADFEAAVRESKQLPGENFYEYSARLSATTREALAQRSLSMPDTTAKSAKRKEYFQQRKDARKATKDRAKQRRRERTERGIDRELEERGLVDHVAFGEVAQAPPQLNKVKHRVATKYKLDKKRAALDEEEDERDFEFQRDPDWEEKSRQRQARDHLQHTQSTSAVQDALTRARKKRKSMGMKQKSDLDADRDRAILQYREAKRRRTEGLDVDVQQEEAGKVLVNDEGLELGIAGW